MGSTSFRVHQTSSAAVHSYGGGGTGVGNSGAIIHRSSGSGVNYAALSYSGAIYVPTKRNAVTAVGASEASDFSAQKMSVVRRAKADSGPGEGEYPGVPEDPAPDPEPPVPVGEMPIVMLVLIVAAYALRIIRRRKAEIARIIRNCRTNMQK